MKANLGADVRAYLQNLVTSALVGGEWSASRPGRFTSGPHWIGRLGGPQIRFGRPGEEKVIEPAGTRTPTPPSSSP
jgi:hypothetical protein